MTDAEFRQAVLDLFPKLKVLAMARTKNGAFAEDIVQDVMVKVWSSPGQILEAVERLEVTLEKYLKRMVVNRFYDVIRRENRLVHDDDFADQLEEVVPSDPTRRNLLLRDLARHLANIGDDCRGLLVERAAGIKQQELADRRAISQSAVNKRIAKCLKELHESCGGSLHDA
ncbi:MAG: sigma-70 family RNA polymerase sigma factor [Rhodobacteraceae bacterium]|nr:sigma-70 family RNA polymerase sigma factor [Paracoccaceae bacterium]